MSTELSPKNEQFIQQAVAIGLFNDREHALNEAVEILKRRQRLIEHIDEGTRQLREGEAIVLNGEEELKAFFEDLKADCRKRYEERETCSTG
jgi:Arc/MetJ-type ribon-helix-helix transcriptional regulator